MKTKTISIIAGIALAFTICIVYTGCKKEDKKPKGYSAASDNANADNAFAGIWKQISKVSNDSSQLRSSGYPTFSITPFDLTTWPKDVVIDFGPTNILGSDLVNRRGKISAGAWQTGHAAGFQSRVNGFDSHRTRFVQLSLAAP